MAQECWHNFSRKCLDQYRWVVHWVEKTLKTPTAKLDRLVLLVDSLTAQTQDKFKETVSRQNNRFELSNRSHLIEEHQDYFQCATKNHETFTDNPPIEIYIKPLKME